MVSPIQQANAAASQFMSDPNVAADAMEGAVRDELSKLRTPGVRDRGEAEAVLAGARRMLSCMPSPPSGLRGAADDLEAMLSNIPRDAIAAPARPGLLGLAAPRAALPNALAATQRHTLPVPAGMQVIQTATATVLAARATTGLSTADCAPAASLRMTVADLPALAHLTLNEATHIARQAGATTDARRVVDAVAHGAGIAFWGSVRDEVTTSLTRAADRLASIAQRGPLGRLCQSIVDGDPTAIAFVTALGAPHDDLVALAYDRDLSGVRGLVSAALRAAEGTVRQTCSDVGSQQPHPVTFLHDFPAAVDRVAGRTGLQMATLDFERAPTFVLEQGVRGELDAARTQEHIATVSAVLASVALDPFGAWATIPLMLGLGAIRTGAAWERVDTARAAMLAGDVDAGAVDRARGEAVTTTIGSVTDVALAGVAGLGEAQAAGLAARAEGGLAHAEERSAEAIVEAGMPGASAEAQRTASAALDAEVDAARTVTTAQSAEGHLSLGHLTLDAGRGLLPKEDAVRH